MKSTNELNKEVFLQPMDASINILADMLKALEEVEEYKKSKDSNI